MNVLSRAAVTVLVVAAIVFGAETARAEARADASCAPVDPSKCDRVWALEEMLPRADIVTLAKTCRANQRELNDWVSSNSKENNGALPARADLDRIALRLSSFNPWAVGLLKDLLSPCVLAGPPDDRAERIGRFFAVLAAEHERYLESSEDNKKAHRCRNLFESVATYARGRVQGGHPLAPQMAALGSRSGAGCRQMIFERAGFEAAARSTVDQHLSRSVLVGVYGLLGDEVTIIRAGRDTQTSAPSTVRAEVLAADRAMTLDERIVFVTAVPRGVAITVRIDGPRRSAWHAQHYFADMDLPVWSEVSNGCLDVQVDASDVVMLLDGHPIGDGPNFLPGTDATHRLTVMRLLDPSEAEADPEPDILAQRSVPAEALKQGGTCSAVRLDLRDNRSVSTTFDVGLLGVSVGPACGDAGVDELGLRARALAYLGKMAPGVTVRDVSAMANLVDGFADQLRRLQALGGSPVGGSRERLATTDTLGTVATEFVRQGFGTLVTVDLRCSRRPAGQFDYSFLVHKINVHDIGLQERDPVLGMRIKDLVTTESEHVVSVRDLRRGLTAVLARLFDISYIRLTDAHETRERFAPVNYRAEVFVATRDAGTRYVPRLWAEPLSGQAARDLCDRLYDWETLRSDAGLEVNLPMVPQPNDGLEAVPHAHRSTVVLTQNPTGTGTYLLKAALYSEPASDKHHSLPGRVIADDDVCVQIGDPRFELWGTIGQTLLRPLSAGRPENYQYAYATVGFGLDRQWSLHGVLGVSQTVRSGQTPPSWQDLGSRLPYDPLGQIDYQVVERALLFGIAFGGKVPLFCGHWPRWCNEYGRSWDLVGRVMPLLSMSFLDDADVPGQLVDFKGPGANPDFDVTLLGQLGARYHWQPHVSFEVLVNGGYPKFLNAAGIKFLKNDDDSHRRRARFDNHWVLGIGFGLVADI